MTDQTTPTPLHDEVDVFTRPDDIVASVGKKVRIYYHASRNPNPATRVGWVVDGGQRGWGVAPARVAEGPAWRLFDSDARPESGLWSGIERVALLSEESDPTAEFRQKVADLERKVEALQEYHRDVAEVINDLIESEDMDDDLADHLREVLDIEAPKPKEVTIEWTVTFTATGTPTTRDAAKKMSDGFADSAFIDSLLIGLDGVDVDEQFLTVDPWYGIGVSIDRSDVS